MKKLIFILGLCLIASSSFAQKKAVKEANSERKAGNFDVARSFIQEALKNPETKDKAETWFTAGMIENDQFVVERDKEKIGERPNQDKMYPALDMTLYYFLTADSLDMIPDAKGRIKPKHRKDIRKMISDNRPYFINAAQYFFNKGNYQKAYNNFTVFSEITEFEMFDEEPILGELEDSIMNLIKYYSGLAAVKIPDNDAAVKIFEEVKDLGVEDNIVHRQLATIYMQQNDTVNYTRILKDGVERFPEEPFYIERLINISLVQGNLDDVEMFLKKAIEITPDKAQLYDMLGMVYESKGDVDSAIEALKKAVEIDSENPATLSHLGRIYYNAGVERRIDVNLLEGKAFEEGKKEVDNFFKQALPFFEQAFKLDPKDRDSVFALRNIYYSLRMNAEYEKMDKIYSELNK